MPEPEIVTRQGKPISVIIAPAEEEALKNGVEEKSKEFVEKARRFTRRREADILAALKERRV